MKPKLHLTMRRIFSLCAITVLLLGGVIKAQEPCKQIIGYYPSWQMYKRGGAVVTEVIDYSRYSILNYSFFAPDSNGYLKGTDPWADTLLLRGRIDWGKPQPAYFTNTSLIDFSHLWGVKVMVSIGGWTCYEEHSGRPDVDKENFTKFMYAIRLGIDSLGKTMGRIDEDKFLLTAAFGANKGQMDCIEYKKVSEFMDYINMMTYDFNGVWSPDANHNSPLYSPSSGYEGSLDLAFKLLQEKGVPAKKINLGVAFYGRSLKGFKGKEPAMYAEHDGKADVERYPLHEGMPLYYRIVDEMDAYDKQEWDEAAQNPYAISTKDSSLISYDNEKSIRLKAKYALDNKCAGVIIWDATGDYIEKKKGSLLISGTPLVDQLVDVLQPCEMPRIKKRY